MKRVLFCIIFLFYCCLPSIAQMSDNGGRITINVYQSSNDDIDNVSANILESKMLQLITLYGIADNGISDRFVITSKIDITRHDVILGYPSRVSIDANITFLIGDIIENIIFESVSFTRKGLGYNKSDALIMAIKSINVNDYQLKEFMEEAQLDIIQYYQINCQQIISSAYANANIHQYDVALSDLLSVPNIDPELYEMCQQAIVEIYQMKIDYDGKQLLHLARGEWAQSPDADGATKALHYIKQISTMANCYVQVTELISQITHTIKAQDKQKWDFMVEQYHDEIELNKQSIELEREQFITNAEIRKLAVSAARDIAIEYSKAKKYTINYNNTFIW